ncbi:hypothetical protein ElyMa_006722600 [Elysia marginata]|uniref:Uncharacterized protein n=1 Tax=Elysia marginata TaxID=1093978 RepID=A0AAV4ISD8_9GAST|nr:hypothetical protein ElyMa_006722600 [Elysia marginata]
MFMGRRGRGRLREKTTDGLASWLGVGSTVEMIKMTREHDVWRGMIANAMHTALDDDDDDESLKNSLAFACTWE